MGHGVRLWLEAMRLPQYAEAFAAQGYDDLDVIADLAEEVGEIAESEREKEREKKIERKR